MAPRDRGELSAPGSRCCREEKRLPWAGPGLAAERNGLLSWLVSLGEERQGPGLPTAWR